MLKQQRYLRKNVLEVIALVAAPGTQRVTCVLELVGCLGIRCDKTLLSMYQILQKLQVIISQRRDHGIVSHRRLGLAEQRHGEMQQKAVPRARLQRAPTITYGLGRARATDLPSRPCTPGRPAWV